MKQIFTLVLLSAALLAKSAPADNHPVKPASVKAVGASKSNGYQVAFEHKGQYITAEYNAAGKLRWYKKHIASTQLPTSLQIALKNRFGNYWIADVVEQSGKSRTTYQLTMENGSQKVTLNATGGSWQTVKTVNKA